MDHLDLFEPPRVPKKLVNGPASWLDEDEHPDVPGESFPWLPEDSG